MADRKQRLLEEMLVLGVRSGRRESFELLIRSFQQPLLRHARRLTGDEDAAWDVVQDTWIAVVRGIGKLADPAALRAWLFGIVTRRASDWLRKRQRDRTVELPEADVTDETETVDASVEEVREALAELPRGPRALLALHYADGFELHEIAGILDIPEGTVKSRLFYARRRLRNIIERRRQ